MPWNLDSSRPIYLQIIERVQMDIITGRYQPGDKLPSVRERAANRAASNSFIFIVRSKFAMPLRPARRTSSGRSAHGPRAAARRRGTASGADCTPGPAYSAPA